MEIERKKPINIIDLIEKNPITKLSNTYQSRLVNKIKESFSSNEQQLFVASFYCYLNYAKDEFVIDLNDVWKWLGFTRKDSAKKLLEKYFKVEIDYKIVFRHLAENLNGGRPSEQILMTNKTFKKLCMKANTSKSDEIHDYFIKLEETLHDLVEEESNELRRQLENKIKENGFLQNKINRAQKREKFPDNNVVYLITAKELKEDGIFMVGKAVDLKIRMTTYNKSLEHEVIYYKNFKNMYHMRTAEMMILYKLNKYRDPLSNKDRFILPKDKDISIFTNIIDEAVQWFNNIENTQTIEDENMIDEEEEEDEDEDESRKYESNLVYMLSSRIHIKTRTYIIGKTKNLNSRLSAYNKGLDHDVIYTRKCNNELQMAVIELMILYKLDMYRERANRDRYILPDDKNVNFFTDVFDAAIEWFNDVDKKIEIIKDKETTDQERKESKREYRELTRETQAERNKIYREKNREQLLVKQKIYRETHKKQVSDIKKEWYNRNKESVIERVKKNYEDNKDIKLAKVKDYASKNKEKIKERTLITITCECGSVVRKYGLGQHLKTTIHKEYMDKLNANSAIVLESDKV